MKKKLFVCLGILLLLMANLGMAALAANTYSGKKSNVFSIAKLKGTADNAYMVTNQSDRVALVRVMVLPVVTQTDSTAVRVLSHDALTGGVPATDWEDGGDGYYYCKKPVPAGESIPVFITPPGLSDTVPEDLEGAEITVEIKAEFSSTVCYSTDGYAYRDAWFGGVAPTGDPLQSIDADIQAGINP